MAHAESFSILDESVVRHVLSMGPRKRRAAAQGTPPMTRLIRTASAAFLLAAVFAAPAVAAPPAHGVAEFKVAFTYDPQASPQAIYSDLRRTARKACEADGVRSLKQRLQEQACAARLLDRAVERVGRSDVAGVHSSFEQRG